MFSESSTLKTNANIIYPLLFPKVAEVLAQVMLQPRHCFLLKYTHIPPGILWFYYMHEFAHIHKTEKKKMAWGLLYKEVEKNIRFDFFFLSSVLDFSLFSHFYISHVRFQFLHYSKIPDYWQSCQSRELAFSHRTSNVTAIKLTSVYRSCVQ